MFKSSMQTNLVALVDGISRTSVTSVDIRFTSDSAGTVDFLNARAIFFTGVGGPNPFEFDASAPLTTPPALDSASEPGTLGSIFAGLVMLIFRKKGRGDSAAKPTARVTAPGPNHKKESWPCPWPI